MSPAGTTASVIAAGLGVALALAGAIRLLGEPSAEPGPELLGVAEPVRARAAAPALALAPGAEAARAPEPPDGAWRTAARPPADVPAGVVARVASRRTLPKPPPCDETAPPRGASAPADAAPVRCPPEPVQQVEIDWHAPPAP